MKCPGRLLPLMSAATSCAGFAQLSPATSRAATLSSCDPVLWATPRETDAPERPCQSAGSALLGVVLGLSVAAAPPASPSLAADGVPDFLSGGPPSATLAARIRTEDDAVIRELERETREAERVAGIDEKRARAERGRKAFFDYEAKAAEQTEARIEAAERRALLEEEKDKEEALELKTLEERAEREAELATSRQEKALKRKEAKALLAKERELERRERRAEKAERLFLAEETREREILAQKLAAERAEDKKYEQVEEEYEEAAELAKEDEIELGFLKEFKKKYRN